MAADEARILPDGAHTAPFVEPTSVTVHADGPREDVAYDAGQPGKRDRDQGEIGVAKRVPQRLGRLDRVALGGRRQDLGILVPADDRVGLAGPARREAAEAPMSPVPTTAHARSGLTPSASARRRGKRGRATGGR